MMQKTRTWLNHHPIVAGPALLAVALLGAALVVWQTGAVQSPVAAGPGEGSGAAPGAGGPGGGANAGRFAAMMREHPQAFALGRFVRVLDEMDQEGKHPLTAQQAATVLGAIRPLQSKENLDEGSARRTLAQLKGVLTPEQQQDIEAASARSPFGGSRPPGGGAGAAGGPGAARGPGAPTGANPSGAAAGSTTGGGPQPFNPLSVQAPANNERAARRAERIRGFTARIEQRAKAGTGG
jgi:hypothetical protein